MLLSLMPTNVVFAEEHVHTAECNHEAQSDAVEAVQALIDALPTATEATADDYDMVQDAFDAYDALTDEEKALITGADVFEPLFNKFNAQTEPALTGELQYIDENGQTQTVQDSYVVLESKDSSVELWESAYYYVEGNVTITGGIDFEKKGAMLILGDGAKLTMDGGEFLYSNLTVTTVPGAQNAELVLNGSGVDYTVHTNNSNLNIYAGKVTVTGAQDRSNMAAVYVDGGNLNVLGSAELLVTASDIEDDTNTATNRGIYIKNGDMTVAGTAVVNATAGKATEKATGSSKYGFSYGIWVDGGSVEVKDDAKLIAKGGEASGVGGKSIGLYITKNTKASDTKILDVTDHAVLEAYGGDVSSSSTANGYGVCLEDVGTSGEANLTTDQAIIMSAGEVKTTGAVNNRDAYSMGILAQCTVNLKSNITVTAKKAEAASERKTHSYGFWINKYYHSNPVLNVDGAKIIAETDKTVGDFIDVYTPSSAISAKNGAKIYGAESGTGPVIIKAKSLDVTDGTTPCDITLAVGSEFTGDGTESVVTRNSNQTGNNISTLLADGTAFFDGEGGLITAHGHFIGLAKATVGEHSCSYNATGNCACGKECAHGTVNPTTGKCTTCGVDAAKVKLTHGTTASYYSKLADAVEVVQEGDTITVLQPLGNPEDDLNIQIDRTGKPLVGFTVDFGGFSYFKAGIEVKNCNLTVKNFDVNYNVLGDDEVAISAPVGGSLTIGDNVRLISTVIMRMPLVYSFVPVTVSGNNVIIGFINVNVDVKNLTSIGVDGNLTVKSGDFYGKVVQDGDTSVSISGGTFRGGLSLSRNVTDGYNGALEKGCAYADITTGENMAPSSIDDRTAFKVVQCNHKDSGGSYSVTGDVCNYCGRSCATDGHCYPTSISTACVICGVGSCAHANVSATGLCSDCNTQFKVKRVIDNGTEQQGGSFNGTVWGTSVGEAIANPVLRAATKDIITLYADTVEPENISWLGNREINFNGHTLKGDILDYVGMYRFSGTGTLDGNIHTFADDGFRKSLEGRETDITVTGKITIYGRQGNHLIRGLTILGGVETQSTYSQSLSDHLNIGDVLAKCDSNGEYTVIYEPGLSMEIDEPVKVIACPHSNNGTTTIGADGKCTLCRADCSHIDATGASAVGIDGVCSVCGNKLAFKVTRGVLPAYWTDDFADALSKVKDATAFENAVILFTGETEKTARIEILSLTLPSGVYKIDLDGRELNVSEEEGSTETGNITVAEGTSVTLTSSMRDTLMIGNDYYNARVIGVINQTGGTLNLGTVICSYNVIITGGTTVVKGTTFFGPFAMAGGNITIYDAYMDSLGFGMSDSMGKKFKDIIAPGYTLSDYNSPINYSDWSGLTQYTAAVRVIKCEHSFNSEDTCVWCNTSCNHKTEGDALNVGEDGKCKNCDYQYYAAKVSEGSTATYYKTLTEAFSAMAAGKTLSLLADCNITESVSLKAGTYDLGDFHIRSSDTVTVPAGVSVTLKSKLDDEGIGTRFGARFSLEGTLNIKEVVIDEITLGQNGVLVAEDSWIDNINATALSGGSISLKAGCRIMRIAAPATGSVLDFLGDGCAYHVYDGATQEYVLKNAAVDTLLIDAKVLAHACDYDAESSCVCGRVCTHPNGFKNSSHACNVCGNPCSHKTAGGDWAYSGGICSICDQSCTHKDQNGDYCFDTHFQCTICGVECPHSGGFKNQSHTCAACGAPCPHNSVSETGLCADCDTQFKIKVTVKLNNGDIVNEAWAESLIEALTFTSDDHYVELELYSDTASEGTVTVERCKSINLNGKTLNASLGVNDELLLQNDIDNDAYGVVSGTVTSYQGANLNVGKNVQIAGLLTLNNSGDSIATGTILAGGVATNATDKLLKDHMDKNSAFEDNWDEIVSGYVTEITGAVKIVEHYQHNTLASDGEHCRCGAAVVAKLESNGKVRYFEKLTDDGAACDAVNNGDTLTLLASNVIVTKVWNIGKTFTLDLNGKTLSSDSVGKIRIASGTISFTDRSTGTPGTVSAQIEVDGALSVKANVSFTGNVHVYAGGEIEIDEVNAKTANFKNLTVYGENPTLKGGKFESISAASGEYITRCLAEGYAFCDESSTPKKWYDVYANKELVENVTIKPVPIKEFKLTSNDVRCILGKNATITAELTLLNASSPCTYEWFDLTGGGLKSLSGNDSSITITAPALGEHRYQCVVTVDGYKSRVLIDITVEECNHKNTNGTVAFNEQTGICSLCDKTVVASIASEYYTDIHKAANALTQVGTTLTLLQNVTVDGAAGIELELANVNSAATVDLNGKTLTAKKLSIEKGVITMKNGSVVISDNSGTFNVSSNSKLIVEESGIDVTGKLVINDGVFEPSRLYGGSYSAIEMTTSDIGTILPDGYGIRTEAGVWYTNGNNSQNVVQNVQNVTVKKLPITDVTVSTDKESYTYKDRGILTVNATLATGVTETPTYKWYRVLDGNEELMQDKTESVTLPALAAGERVFKCVVTVDGYSKTGTVTFNVAPKTPVVEDDFTGLSGKILTYNTKEQEIVNVTSNKVGTFHYRLGKTGTWTTTCPKGKDAKLYEIYWYLESTNSNYTDLGSEQNPQGPFYAMIEELDISKMNNIILSSEQTVELTYTGVAQEPTFSLSLKTRPETAPSQLLEELVQYTDYTLWNVTAQTDAGTYEATVAGMGNLKGETTVSWKINPAAAPTNAVATVDFYSNIQKSYAVDLGTLLPELGQGKSYGTLSGTIGRYSGSANITNVAVDGNNKFTFTVANKAFSEGTVGQVTVDVMTQNYGGFELDVNLNAKPRPVPTGNPVLSKTEITYGDTVGSVSFASSSLTGESGESVPGTFTWKNGTAAPSVTDSFSAAWEFTPEEGSVYDKASGTAQLKIKPAELTNVSVTADELTYNGTEQTPMLTKTATAVGQNSVTFTYSENKNGTYSDDVPQFRNAGTYTVYYKASANNHVTADGSFTVKINKRKIGITALVENKVYDGTVDANAVIRFGNLAGGDELEEEVDYSVTATFDHKNSGTRTAEVAVTLKETALAQNYELEKSSDSVDANIRQKQLKITAATVSNKYYDGTVDATVTSVTFDGLVGNDSLVLGTDYTAEAFFDNKNVGENKKVSLKVSTENTYVTRNYSFDGLTFNNATATIIPLTATAPVFNNNSTYYTGATISHEPIEVPFAGVTAVSYTYEGIQGTVYASTSAAPTNAGVYNVTASFTMAEGYAQLSPVTSMLVIMKADNPWIVQPSVSNWTYGEKAKVTVGQSKFGTVKVSYKKVGESDENYSDTVPTAAGEYNVCFNVEGTDNYGNNMVETGFRIERKPVTDGAVVGAFDSMTYSGEEQLPKASVMLDNEPVTGNWSAVTNVSDKTTFTATGNFTGTISDKETSMAKATLKASTEKPTTAILRRGEALKYASIIEGDILGVGDMPVSGGFQWVNEEEVLNTSGKASVRFTEENGNYEPLVFDIEVSTYSGGSGGRRNDNIIVVVTENEDGSVTTTTTNKLTGTVTEVTEWPDGSSLSTETRKNGNKTVIEKDTEGTVTETKTDAKGNVTTVAKREDGVSVTTKETADGEKTTEITVPKNKEAEVTLPVSDPEEIEKIIVTDKDGNKTEITDFERSESGVVISVSESCTVELVKGEKPASRKFADVHDVAHWATESIDYICNKGLMNGITEDEFGPDMPLTRAMLVTILYRAEGEPDVNAAVEFYDVSKNSYYEKAVIWAKENGIISGVSENLFAPDENITREQIATIIFRYASFKGVAPEGAWAIRLNYADAAEISDYAVEAVMYCTLKGIMQGKTDELLAPGEMATRAEIAVILQRFLEA